MSEDLPARPGERHGGPDRFEAQQSAGTASHALAAGQAMAVLHRFAPPDVPPHVDPHGAVERADPALDAAARLGHDPSCRESLVVCSIGREPVKGLMAPFESAVVLPPRALVSLSTLWRRATRSCLRTPPWRLTWGGAWCAPHTAPSPRICARFSTSAAACARRCGCPRSPRRSRCCRPSRPCRSPAAGSCRPRPRRAGACPQDRRSC